MYNTNHKIKKIYTEIPDDERITSEVMTRFEYTNVVATRARQLEQGSMAFVDYSNITDYKKIAELEILTKKCPIDIIRKLNNNYIERWHVNEMIIPKI